MAQSSPDADGAIAASRMADRQTKATSFRKEIIVDLTDHTSANTIRTGFLTAHFAAATFLKKCRKPAFGL